MGKCKKVLCLMLVSILAIGVLITGCGSSSNTTSSDSTAAGDTAAASSTVAETSKLDPYEIVWYTVSNPQTDMDKVFSEVSKYATEKINATVKIVPVSWGDYNTKMPLVLAAGEPLDICFTCNWMNNYAANVNKGAYLPIDDLMQKYGQNLLKILPQSAIDAAKIGGKLYAVPANKDFAYYWAIAYKEDVANEYGFDMSKVTKLEDLEPMLKVVKEGKKYTPFMTNQTILNPGKDLNTFVSQDVKIPLGQYAEGGDDKFFNLLEKPEYSTITKLFRKWYQEGYLQKDVATIKDNTAIQKPGKYFAEVLSYLPAKEISDSVSRGYKVKAIPITKPITGDSQGSMQAIAKASKNPERTMMFLDLLNSDQYLLNLVDYGIKDDHYTLTADNRLVIPENNVGEKARYSVAQFTIGNVFLQYLNKDDPADKWDLFKQMNDTAIKSPLSGFTFNTEPVKNEYAACAAVYDQYIPALSLGAVDTDKYLPKAIEAYKAAGLDKIMTEMQKQYDEWKASNK